MLILDGQEVSRVSREALAGQIQTFTQKKGRAPHLTVIIVGEDKASQVYVRNKHKACEKLGMSSSIEALSAQATQKELNDKITQLNNDEAVDGILVQLPLPGHLSVDQVLALISPLKDVDGLTYTSLGYLFAGKPLVRPCTPAGIMTILKHYKISLEGLKVAVVGRSNIVGKPMALMLSEANATVTICHSKTKNLSATLREADLVVVAAGRAEFLGKADFKEGVIVIDVGMHGSGSGGKLCGDVRFEELKGWAKAATPVPGGVGPMTITTLLQNTCLLAEKRAGL